MRRKEDKQPVEIEATGSEMVSAEGQRNKEQSSASDWARDPNDLPDGPDVTELPQTKGPSDD